MMSVVYVWQGSLAGSSGDAADRQNRQDRKENSGLPSNDETHQSCSGLHHHLSVTHVICHVTVSNVCFVSQRRACGPAALLSFQLTAHFLKVCDVSKGQDSDNGCSVNLPVLMSVCVCFRRW